MSLYIAIFALAVSLVALMYALYPFLLEKYWERRTLRSLRRVKRQLERLVEERRRERGDSDHA